jgi:hypothetical protein
MAKNFQNNRTKVQKYFLATDFLVPLNADDLPLEIKEDKNQGTGKLELLTILNIPCSENDYFPKSWVLDLELEKQIFSAPQGIKKGEKAIIFLSCTTLYVIIIEMKESLQPYGDGGLEGIEKKINHSLSRISMLLPIYLFDQNEQYRDIDAIIYKSIICYNKDEVTHQSKTDQTIQTIPLYKIFSEQEKLYHFTDILGQAHQIEVFFEQNQSSDKSEMEIDLATIFEKSRDNDDFLTCQYTELSCP